MASKGRLLPVPNLDDRDWRAIKDAMVQAIPQRAPEWTDHNLSDPGVTLMETFALQIEQLIVRLNQVLPKHLREYLNLIGVTLTPPSAARALCFFRPVSRPSFDVTVLKGFEIATAGASGDKPLVFSTDRDLVIHAARLKRVLGDRSGVLSDFTAEANAPPPGMAFAPLPGVQAGDALYLAYDADDYFEALDALLDTPSAGITGVWEFYEERADGTASWEPLPLPPGGDGTLGLTQEGRLAFEVPARWEAVSVGGELATWLRFRVTAVAPAGAFAVLRGLSIDRVLGRVPCSHAVQVTGEILGSSSGGIDQRFFISKVPVLDLALEVDEGTGFQAWAEVEDFADSGPADRHYLLNRGTGEVLFGDGLRGRAPAQGTGNVRAGYRYGGGARGNVGAGTLIRMRQTHPFVASVTNKEAASGGGDEETVEEAIARGPSETLRTRNRAVVAEDFETLALESSTGIARAKTLPLFDPAEPLVEKPGLVSVIVLPKGGAPLSLALRDQVRSYLDERRLVTTRIFVVEAEFVDLDLEVTVLKTPEANPVALEALLRAAVLEYYDPEAGGDPARAVAYVRGLSTSRGDGWEFGRDVFRSELFELLERVAGVDHVEAIALPAATVPLSDHQLPRVHNLSVTVAA